METLICSLQALTLPRYSAPQVLATRGSGDPSPLDLQSSIDNDLEVSPMSRRSRDSETRSFRHRKKRRTSQRRCEAASRASPTTCREDSAECETLAKCLDAETGDLKQLLACGDEKPFGKELREACRYLILALLAVFLCLSPELRLCVAQGAGAGGS